MIQDLFKSPGIRRNSIVMMFCWLAISIGHFGLIYNAPSFKANIDLVLIFPALMGIPVSIFQPYFDNRVGRKSMMTIPLVTAGILTIITTGIPKGDPIGNWSVIILASVSACCCGMGFGIGHIFTLELYPNNCIGNGFSCWPTWISVVYIDCNAFRNSSFSSSWNLWYHNFRCRTFISVIVARNIEYEFFRNTGRM